MGPPPIIVYELNEVPWEIVDLYVDRRPSSALARLVEEGCCRTTVDDDPVDLQPWRTWPTFHTSSFTDEHNAFDLGQDPSTFRGVPIWDAADRAGFAVGLFGVLQSWPARPFASGGFHVPDTFASSPATVPPALERFQAFNLAMTAENSFAAGSPIGGARMVAAAADLARRGLTVRAAVEIAAHLGRERFDARHRAARSIMQAMPSFDVFWRLVDQTRPALSIFFTNHVAGMLHRFWGDAVPGYQAEGHRVDPLAGSFVLKAMDVFDRHLSRIMRWVDANGPATVVVASSMGQGPVPFHAMDETYVVDDAARLCATLGIVARPRLAMYPRLALDLDDPAGAAAARTALLSVSAGGSPLFRDPRVVGTTVSVEVAYALDETELARAATWRRADGTEQSGDIGALGVSARARPRGGNTGYHVPEGMLVAVGPALTADPSRAEVDILDAAPSLLSLLGDVTPPSSWRGEATMFR